MSETTTVTKDTNRYVVCIRFATLVVFVVLDGFVV